MDEDKVDALLRYACEGNRICPNPDKWLEFWKLIGSPSKSILPPPLILGGWAFSSDREKRNRFAEHVRFAADNGFTDKTQEFVSSLVGADWHTSPDRLLDWSYGQALIEDEAKRQATIERARSLYAQLREISNSRAFDQARFGATLCLYYVLFISETDVQTKIARLHESIQSYVSLAEADQTFIFEGTDEIVIAEVKSLKDRMHIELLLLEILQCIAPPNSTGQVSTARGDIDEFLGDVFDVP